MFIDGIYSNMDALKKSVADGKKSVASAISAKGVSTATDASFAILATNIGKISNNLKKISLGSNGISNNNASPADTWRTTTFSATSIPGYNKLTANNFVAIPKLVANLNPSSGTTYPRCQVRNVSYNPENGIVTVEYNLKTWAVGGIAYWNGSIECIGFYI